MLNIVSDMLVLKSVEMKPNESNNTFEIKLSLKNLDGKYINQIFEYHNYNEAINDFLVLTKSIKGGR
jgi:uncharacterized protein YjlB